MPQSHRPLRNDRSVTFRVPSDLYDLIAWAAEREHRSVSNYIVKLLAEHGRRLRKKKGGK
jgi:uncharacterized protein (DUF1778 family)